MSDNQSMKSMLQLSDVCEWVNAQLAALLTEGGDNRNPFSREFLVDALQKFARRVTHQSSWHDRVSYSEWAKGDDYSFVPAAFSQVSVWQDNREKAMAEAALAADDSLRKYATLYPPWRFSVDEFQIERMYEQVSSDIRLHPQLGRRIKMFGSVLNIEAVVRLTEHRVRVAVPDIFAELHWNYEANDFAVAEYLRGTCEDDVENLLLLHWDEYTTSVSRGTQEKSE